MSLFCLVLVIIGIGSIKGLYRWSYNIKTGTIPIFITITNPRCTELRLLYRQAEIFFLLRRRYNELQEISRCYTCRRCNEDMASIKYVICSGDACCTSCRIYFDRLFLQEILTALAGDT